tara:strand:- start:288 stop:467 length:180 start_codon:yes stop_codon:yes gene_type:complete
LTTELCIPVYATDFVGLHPELAQLLWTYGALEEADLKCVVAVADCQVTRVHTVEKLLTL